MRYLFLLITILSFSNCNHTSFTPDTPQTPDPTDTTQTTNPDTTILNPPTGDWKVTLYSVNGTDETSLFTAYTFTFGSLAPGLNFTAYLPDGSTKTGTWLPGVDDSGLCFNGFTGNAALEKMVHCWWWRAFDNRDHVKQLKYNQEDTLPRIRLTLEKI